MDRGAPAGTAPAGEISAKELQLAARNHGMPLEALRHDLTPAGLHYLLIHYDIPAVELEAYTLEVTGEVERSMSLTLGELRARDCATLPITFECAGNGRALLSPRPISQPWLTEAVGTAEWGGALLSDLLTEAGVRDGAVEVLFTGLDQGVEGGVEQAYQRSLPLEEATSTGTVLAYEMNGGPLPPQHGFPVRLVVPGWYGMTNVKWLSRIDVLSEPFDGYQNAVAYRMYDEDGNPGEPVTRMRPRSLTLPPGVPDFMSRERHLDAGPVTLRGRAWSGWGAVERVEVSTDGGATWADAALDPPLSATAWRGWSWVWDAAPGDHEICSRATDAAGHTQPLEPEWNLKGYANNAVERMTVRVG